MNKYSATSQNMRQIKVLAGTVSFLTLIGMGYYGSSKSVERMYGMSLGLIAGGIFAQTTKDATHPQPASYSFQRSSNSKRRRQILRSLRSQAGKINAAT